MNRIDDLEDIIKILIDILENNNISKDVIRLELRKYHYCYDCLNHYRGCKCDEISNNSLNESSSYDDNYTSSEDSNNSDLDKYPK